MARMDNYPERVTKFLMEMRETADRLEEWSSQANAMLEAVDFPQETRETIHEALREYTIKVRELSSEAAYLLE